MGFIREVRKDIEQEALRLIREYYAMLAGEARRLGADEHSARDLAIKAIETYLEKPEGELPDESGVRSWLVATLRNHYHHFVRGKARACTVYLDPEDVERLAELGPADNSTDEAILAHSDAEFVRNVISRLPESTRSVLMLRYFESLSIRQIAELLRKSPDSVRSNLYYARKVLAKRLGKAFGRSALAIAALLFGGSLLYAAAVVAGFAPSPFAAAEPVAEDAEFDFNAKNTENTEGALTGFTGFPTEGTDPAPAATNHESRTTNHETQGDSPQQVEAITDNSNTNNEENAMNTKLVKSAAVKALALGAMLMSTPAQAADYYVAKTGSDGNAGTQGAPFATIAKAITEANTAIDGGADSATIYVGDGTYAEHTLTLEKPITIVGESGNRDAVIVNANGSSSNKRRTFTLNHAAATLSGITVKNGYMNVSGNNAGGNILISANGGVVTNCVVANGYASGGGNIYMNGEAALVLECVVTNGTVNWSKGGNIAATYGRVSRCLVANGTSLAQYGGETSGDSGNVYLGNSAVMENCLITGGVVRDNNAKNANGVYMAGSSRLVNCTIVKNRSDSYALVPAVNASADTVRVVNCVVYGNGGTAAREWGNANGACYVNCATASGAAITGGTGNIATVTDVAFADYAGGDYCPARRGVLANVGTSWADYLAYGAVSTLDLAGAARFYGGCLDIGCYESDAAGFTLPDYYVAKTGDDDNDGTQASPFATIGTAIAAANATIAGGFAAAVTIHVGDGTYAEHSLTLEKPITIVGESGNRDAVIVNPNGSASNPRRAFTLNHAAATVSGITMKNGHARGSGTAGAGGNVLIDSNGGVVTNCVVANGYAAGGGNIRLNGAGALVVDCVVTNGTADWSRGGNIYAYPGRVSRCLVANGTVKAGGTDTGDAGNAYLGLSAVMENCLVMGGSVADNSAGNANGVYLADESRLVNCTIVKNRTDSRAHVPAVNASADTVRVVNCAIYGNGGTAAREWGNVNGACYVNCATASGAAITGGTGNIATLTDSAFADYAGGDYHPQKKGVLCNAGTGRDEYFAFGAESLFDLGRSDRISGARLDIGCYEFYVSGSVFYFR
ncbi:MAG: sigma-70 family RNA polymerase sigma factor [Kiritimatiellae bacterium]|nr:sigma-70 family RNA polymerase sigma factor [Kiritimatiellia bacterium]